MILFEAMITALNHRCNTCHPVKDQSPTRPSTVSKAADIDAQHIMDLVGGQDIMDMAEDIVVLSDRRRLTFREASDNEGTEEVIIMARVVVGMAEVVIQAAVRTTHHGQFSSGDMAVVAVAVVEVSQSGQSARLTDELEGLVQLILLGGEVIGACLRYLVQSNSALIVESLRRKIFGTIHQVVLREDSGACDEPSWMSASYWISQVDPWKQ